VHYSVAKLHMDELLKALHSTHGGAGLLDFSTELSMRGFDVADLTSSAQGQAMASGTDLTLELGNLDEKFSRYESSQNFNLIDVGAFFLAGPLGTAVTKGYNFAAVLENTEGSTAVPAFVSHWKIERGVAHADDVAMATPKNRVAMRGGLDFVNRQFDDVIIALLDDKGCSRVEQKIHGPFAKPEIEQPNVLISLAGPVTRLLRSAKAMVGGKCEPFYTGSVQPEPGKK
jgi:AsmA protein